MPSWNAIYQGKPVERDGLLFTPATTRTYNNVLPQIKPTRKFAYVDVAWGGGDYVAMPIIYQYENELYCVGLDDGRARTLEEVGKEFNVTRERIRQIEAKALRKLRHPSRSRKLKDYLD